VQSVVLAKAQLGDEQRGSGHQERARIAKVVRDVDLEPQFREGRNQEERFGDRRLNYKGSGWGLHHTFDAENGCLR
jgi:hypothetical protein